MDTLKPERIDYLERLVSGVLDMIKENGVEYIDGEECLRATWLDADLLCHVIKEEVLPVLKRTSEWVSVSERLPEKEGFYLTFHSDGDYDIDNLYDNMGHMEFSQHRLTTHWMPLPQAPKGDE